MACKEGCQEIEKHECDDQLCDFVVSAACVTVDFTDLADCLSIETGTLQDVIEALCSVGDHDWYEVGGTNAPEDISDNIYTQGKVSIGKTTAGEVLDVVGDLSVVFQGNKYLRLDNDISLNTKLSLNGDIDFLLGYVETDNVSVLTGKKGVVMMEVDTDVTTGYARMWVDDEPQAVTWVTDGTNVTKTTVQDNKFTAEHNKAELELGALNYPAINAFGAAITGDGAISGYFDLANDNQTGVYAIKDVAQIFTENDGEAASVGVLQGLGIAAVNLAARDSLDKSQIVVGKSAINLTSEVILGSGTQLDITTSGIDIDTVPGFTGTVLNPASITVLKGIVTAVS